MNFKYEIESLAIGSFDSVHIAHRELIDEVDAVIMITDFNKKYIVPNFQRAIYIDKPSYFYSLSLIKNLNANLFIKKLNIDFPNLKKIVVGYDFFCGHNKECRADQLKLYFEHQIVIIDEVKYKNISVHSKIVKKLITDGNIDLVNNLLNREYSISGINIKGQSIGKKNIFPTINLKTNYLLPKNGVYKTLTKIDSIWHKSITFIGNRISTDNNFFIETHIIEKDIEVNLCKLVDLKFISFLRDNIKFTSLEKLKQQIKNDILKVSS